MKDKVGYAALDLGTSRLRAGVFEPTDDGESFQVISDQPNDVRVASGGVARCSFKAQCSAIGKLLSALGVWTKSNGITHLHLGLCGQVSSLLRWDEQSNRPAEDEYPIWMDSTCLPAIRDMSKFWSKGGAQRMLGTCMPAVTTWLAVKARGHAQFQPEDRSTILQIQDAVFRRLTGKCFSHPSSQISLIHQDSWKYAPTVLKYVGLTTERLPRLDKHGTAVAIDAVRAEVGLSPTTVHAGVMDTHAALYGLFPEDGDGLLLTGTSEVLGVFESKAREEPPARMVRARLGDGWIVYGSSASGGNSVRWLVNSALGRNMDKDLERLSEAAAEIPPGCEGLTCLPYFGGERAPLWNSELSGSFVGLRTHHRDAHLLRALFEGIAFTRRQAAEALERPLPSRFLVAGGGAVNALWNKIRASVMNCPLDIMTVGDLALLGTIRHIMLKSGADDAPLRGLLASTRVKPDRQWAKIYEQRYVEFLKTQKMLGISSADGGARA
jgi:xylulokinase